MNIPRAVNIHVEKMTTQKVFDSFQYVLTSQTQTYWLSPWHTEGAVRVEVSQYDIDRFQAFDETNNTLYIFYGCTPTQVDAIVARSEQFLSVFNTLRI